MNWLIVLVAWVLSMLPAELLAQSATGAQVGWLDSNASYGWPALLTMTGIGFVLGPISRFIGRTIARNIPGWRDKALQGDDVVSDFTEKRFGFKVPGVLRGVYEAVVKTVFHETEELARRPEMIRDVLRAAIAISPQRFLSAAAALNAVTDWRGYFYSQLPDDVRELFNLQKKATGEKILAARVKFEEAMAAGDIPAAVDAGATANKSHKIDLIPVVTPETVQQIVAEESSKLRASQVVSAPKEYVQQAPSYAQQLEAIIEEGGDHAKVEELLQKVLAQYEAKRAARNKK